MKEIFSSKKQKTIFKIILLVLLIASVSAWRAIVNEHDDISVPTQVRLEQLKKYEAYKADTVKINFTYTLDQRDKIDEIISKYSLDTVTEGKRDVELMTALLNWVCDTFQHYGQSGLPQKRDAVSVANFAAENSNSVNCRGLSIILAEVCRSYGIIAKHITCMPKEARFNDCHVVVQAYSEELRQWIMLDPTYRLILRNEDGEYLDLPMLRESIINDLPVVPNANAGRNHSRFNLDSYIAYMAKNTFRFSCATDFYSGADEGYQGNVPYMLIPDKYWLFSFNKKTTSDQNFWALP